jgi:IS605 OrfB family transposase
MNMKLTRTIKLKLNISPAEIKPTLEAYTTAFNYVCQMGWREGDFNGVSLHHKTYQATRSYLPSQLAISARMKATEALKSARDRLKKQENVSCPQSKLCAVRYDARSYNVWFERNEVSLLTVDGRKKFPIIVPAYFKQYLDWRRTTTDLFLRKNGVFLHIVFEQEISDVPLTGEVVGTDRGINNIAVTSNNQFFGGGHIKHVSRRYEKLRTKLQSCGSKSAKRHLRKLSKKENRFRADVNHVVSKHIIQSMQPGNVIVLEDLKSIRQTSRLRKKQRKQLHKWNFFQLQQFLTYKAEAKGIRIDYVDSRYTSQKCSVCGYTSRSNRTSQAIFKCKHCGFSLNADLNASRNIRQNYLDATGYPGRVVVNQPIVVSNEAKGSLRATAVEFNYKPPSLDGGS